MGEEEDLVVTATVLPENREVYEALVKMSEDQGLSREDVNTQLFNAGLYAWVDRISRDLDELVEEEQGEGVDAED